MMSAFRMFDDGWRVRIGPVNLRYFQGVGYRITINFCSEFSIRLFGFNQRSFHLFWREA